MGTASTPAASDNLSEAAMARIESGEIDLPVLPNVVLRIMSLSLDQNDSAGDLARILSSDATLVTEILRIANSPAYAGVVEIESLSQAIMRLGFMGLRQIAVTTCLKATAFRSEYFVDALGVLWRDSLQRAFWSREIALMLRDNPDSAYLAGLLRDIGRPIALIALERAGQASLAADDALVSALAMRLGAYIAEHWALPDYVRAAIENDASCYPQLIGIVAVAGAMTDMDGSLTPEAIAATAAQARIPVYLAESEQLCGALPRLEEVLRAH